MTHPFDNTLHTEEWPGVTETTNAFVCFGIGVALTTVVVACEIAEIQRTLFCNTLMFMTGGSGK